MPVVRKSRKKTPKTQNEKLAFIEGRRFALDRSEIADAVVDNKNIARAADEAVPTIKDFIRRSKNDNRCQRLVFLVGLVLDSCDRLIRYKPINKDEASFLMDLESELMESVAEITKSNPRKNMLAVLSLLETAADFAMDEYPQNGNKPLKVS